MARLNGDRIAVEALYDECRQCALFRPDYGLYWTAKGWSPVREYAVRYNLTDALYHCNKFWTLVTVFPT